MVGVPLHAWDEKVLRCLGVCLGVVMEVDDEAKHKQRFDKIRILILRDPQ